MRLLVIMAAAVLFLGVLDKPVQAKGHLYPSYKYDRQYFYFVDPPKNTRVVKKRHITRHAKRHSKRHARHHVKRSHREASAPMKWNMVKVKTVQGFYLTVHPAYAHKFLKFFELLAQNDVKIPKEMVGCYSPGGHKRGSNHHIGAACDIQTGWNRTIPEMYHAGKWIKEAGLYDGCSFSDCGHVEAIRGLYNKAPNLYTSLEKFKSLESTANYQP